MVSTRSSARKVPNPSCPPATSAPTPVADDPPPRCPRRSSRIRIKNGEQLSLQCISSEHQLLHTQQSQLHKQLPISNPLSPEKPPQAPKEVHNETSSHHHTQTADICLGDQRHGHIESHQEPAYDNIHTANTSKQPYPKPALLQELQNVATSGDENERENAISIDSIGSIAMPQGEHHVRSFADHYANAESNDDGPEEVAAVDAQRGVERVMRLAVQREVKKKRRRRRRRKEISTGLPQSDKLHDDENQQNNTDPVGIVEERLSNDAIVAAQTAARHAKARRLAVTKTARLRKQVKRVGNLTNAKRAGDVEVAMVANRHRVRSISKKGRTSAASFLASCIRNGPKRVSSSRLAVIAVSTRSLRT